MNPLEWIQDDAGIDWPRMLLVALSVTVLVAVFLAAATSTAAFGPYNPSWDGTSELRDDVESEPGVESELIRETDRYDAYDANETVAFVVAPDEQYTGDDAERLQRFVENGGTLVVLENFGTSGNELLATVGAETRADGVLLRDEQEYYRGPTMPIATGVENHTLTEGVDQLTLNYASALEPGDATVLVRTSEYAYRDINQDGELSGDEELAASPVATVENVSDGHVVAVGDPSIAVNAMINEPDNAVFLQGLYADADHVLIDLSHGEELPPLASATLTVRGSPLLQLLIGGLGIGAIVLGSRGNVRSAFRRVRTAVSGHKSADGPDAKSVFEIDTEQRTELLRERYPDWDEQRIQRVMAAFKRHGSKRGDDE